MAQLNPNAASFSPVRGGGGAGAGPGPGATSTNSSERQQQQQQLVGFRVKSTYTGPQGVKGKGKGKKTAVGSNVANTSASAANEEDDASRTRGGRGAGAGRKRQNQRQKGGLNHLLNFNSGRTPTHARASEQNRRAHQNARRKQHVPIKYNKDLFVQAQFRFLVSDAVDVTGYLDSPDKMLDWEDVAVLESTSESAIQCPICLDEVKAAQTTTCGHIFCLSCITKYAVLGGCKSDISCPLCFGPISMVNLRSLHHRSVKCAKVGDQKQFYRLRRNKTSIFPSCSNAEDDTAPSVPVSKYGRCFPFAKFTLTADYLSSVRGMVKILEDYGEKLLQGGQEDCCEEELPFVFLAIEVLHERYRSWQERRKGTDGDHSPSSLESMEAVARVRASEAIQNRLKAQKESELWPVLVPNATGITTEVSTSEEKSDKKDGKEVWEQEVSESGGESADDGDHFHSYYQSCDGQNIFLHPVNIKCLLNHYENLGMAPKLLEAPILEIESFNVTEDTRKRFRFCNHLPLSSTVTLCELDLSEILPKAAFKPFLEEIQKRKRRRERAKKKKNREEAKKALEQSASSSLTEFSYMKINHSKEEEFRLETDVSADLGSSPQGISFSNVTKLGFAALGSKVGESSPPREPKQEASPSQVWGSPEISQNFWASREASPNQNPNVVWDKKKKGKKNVLVMRLG